MLFSPPRVPADLPAELLRLAQEARDEAGRLEARASQLRETAALLESRAAEVGEALTSGPERAIVRPVTPAKYRAERTVGRPIASQHPFPRALSAANITVTEWAKAHRVGRSRVKSWFLDGKNGRPIPRAHAENIRGEFAVPLTAWKHGIAD